MIILPDGSSTKDVTVKIDFFNPLPPCHVFSLETSQKSYSTSQISDPPNLKPWHHLWMTPRKYRAIINYRSIRGGQTTAQANFEIQWFFFNILDIFGNCFQIRHIDQLELAAPALDIPENLNNTHKKMYLNHSRNSKESSICMILLGWFK